MPLPRIEDYLEQSQSRDSNSDNDDLADIFDFNYPMQGQPLLQHNNNTSHPPPLPQLVTNGDDASMSPLTLKAEPHSNGRSHTGNSESPNMADSGEFFSANSGTSSSNHRVTSNGSRARRPRRRLIEVDMREELLALSLEASETDGVHTPPNPRDLSDFALAFPRRGSIRNQISRSQSTRVYPVGGFTEMMETRLLRYRPAVTASFNEALLSGEHPFQAEQMPLAPTTSGEPTRPSSGWRPVSLLTGRSTSSTFVADIPAPTVIRSRPVSQRDFAPDDSIHEENSNDGEAARNSSVASVTNTDDFHFEPLTVAATIFRGEPQEIIELDNLELENDTLVADSPTAEVPESTTTSGNEQPQPVTLNTSELLRGFEQLQTQETDSNLNLLLPPGIKTTVSSSLFGTGTGLKRSNAKLTTLAPRPMPEERSTIGGYQRSPMIFEQPRTTSAQLIQNEEFRKLQQDGDGNDENDVNWTSKMCNGIGSLFTNC